MGACETNPTLAPANWPGIFCIVADHYQHLVSSPDYNGAYARRGLPDLAPPSSFLLVPLAFSPCPDVNRGIDLLAIGSSECLSSRLPWVN